VIDSAGSPPEEEAIVEFSILTPNLSAAEIAAVTAVLRTAAAEESLRQDAEDENVPEGWNSGAVRQLRGEIRPGPGQWGRAL
jgi:hypothetical protein